MPSKISFACAACFPPTYPAPSRFRTVTDAATLDAHATLTHSCCRRTSRSVHLCRVRVVVGKRYQTGASPGAGNAHSQLSVYVCPFCFRHGLTMATDTRRVTAQCAASFQRFTNTCPLDFYTVGEGFCRDGQNRLSTGYETLSDTPYR